MKIIHTPVRFYPAVGGVENHVMYLGKELIELGHNVEVVCADVPPSNIQVFNDIRVTRIHSFFNVTNTNITLGLPFYLLNADFDIIHTHMPTPWTCDWSIFIGKLKGKKTILTIHNDMQKVGTLVKLLTDFYLNTVFRFALLLVDKIIIVNPEWEKSFNYTKNLLIPHKNKIVVIPNGVDTNLFRPTKTKIPNSVLFVSILDKYHWFKGTEVLISAMKKLRVLIPDIKLSIIGEGELKNKFQKKVKDENMNDTINFLGYKDQTELADYFSQSSVFVLPSTDTEGFGIVLIEALACGTPVVTTDITGVAQKIINTHSGIVVKPNDVDALQKGIYEILTKKNLGEEMSQNGKKLIDKEFSWSIIGQKVNNLYSALS